MSKKSYKSKTKILIFLENTPVVISSDHFTRPVRPEGEFFNSRQCSEYQAVFLDGQRKRPLIIFQDCEAIETEVHEFMILDETNLHDPFFGEAHRDYRVNGKKEIFVPTADLSNISGDGKAVVAGTEEKVEKTEFKDIYYTRKYFAIWAENELKYIYGEWEQEE